MPAGRPPLPKEIKKARGTLNTTREKRKEKEAAAAASFALVQTVPEPPPHFDAVARDVWQTICQEFINLGVLQTLDVFQLQILCNEMSIYWACINKMGHNITVPTGSGSYKVNPLYQAATTAWNNAARIASAFGMSPTARQKLKIMNPKEKPKDL